MTASARQPTEAFHGRVHLCGWTVHAVVFMLVNAALAVQTGFDPGAGHFWGWGIGLVAHSVAGLPGSKYTD